MTANKESIIVRPAKPEDASALLAIYVPYVEKTAITFEYTVPSLAEFRERIIHTLEKYPYIVAETHGEILGYAYASCFYAREAYDWAVETSIYVAEGARGMGIGGLLHSALENCLTDLGYLNMYACIAYPPTDEDPYLTKNSAAFHAHLGYRLIGTFQSCGCKFDRWYDMIWMEKHLGKHKNGQQLSKPKTFQQLLAEGYTLNAANMGGGSLWTTSKS